MSQCGAKSTGKYVVFVLSHANYYEWAVICGRWIAHANNLCANLAFLISKSNSNVTFFLQGIWNTPRYSDNQCCIRQHITVHNTGASDCYSQSLQLLQVLEGSSFNGRDFILH